MELRHLRYFSAVAELLNFSRAAEKLHVAQPALSRQVRALEDELGVRLFERNHARVRLTDAGRTFYPHVCKILAGVDIGVAAVREVTDGVGGELIVCNDWRVGSDLVPATLAEFHATHPRAAVTLRDLPLHEQLPALRAGKAHLGFIVRDVLGMRDDIDALPVLHSPLMAVLPAAHSLAGQRRVKLAELAAETWTMIDDQEAMGYRAFISQLCRLSGFSPRCGVSTNTLEGFLGRIASGFGIGLLPHHILPRRSPLLRYLETDCDPIELCAVWNRSEHSVLLQDYLDILRRHLAKAARKPPRRRASAAIQA